MESYIRKADELSKEKKVPRFDLEIPAETRIWALKKDDEQKDPDAFELLKKAFLPLACFLLMTTNVWAMTGQASWYSVEACQFNPHEGCPTASGRSLYALEKEGVNYAAMWSLPFGTRLRVTNLHNGKHTEVVVLDRGPNKRFKERVIDLSKKAFAEIASTRQGLVNVKVEVL